MRIAQIAPLYEAVPPPLYGGTERVIAGLCDGLADLGHDVTLFAANASSTRARLERVSRPLRAEMSREELIEVAPHLHLRMLADVADRCEEFDVVHSHVDLWSLPFAHRSATPWLLTLHGRLDVDPMQEVLPLYPGVALVSISNDQRVPLRDRELRWAGTVYNGLDLGHYPTHDRPRDGHLAFMGRISPEKGPTLAIEVARRSGLPLQLAAKVDPMDEEYFGAEVEPLLGDDAQLVGEVDEEHKPAFLSSAVATLFPSDWPEPFGLVLVESMAAGTPVIALRRGAVPEIVEDGVSGFICDDVDEMVAAVGRVSEIDPEECRRQAARFGADVMCAGYLDIYRSLCRSPGQTARRSVVPAGSAASAGG
jgi:glycosyltransferase involved in cell wall biosynthesis